MHFYSLDLSEELHEPKAQLTILCLWDDSLDNCINSNPYFKVNRQELTNSLKAGSVFY
jgi:hypothetical protein